MKISHDSNRERTLFASVRTQIVSDRRGRYIELILDDGKGSKAVVSLDEARDFIEGLNRELLRVASVDGDPLRIAETYRRS